MGVPQIILLTLLGIQLLVNAHLHGKPRTGNYSFLQAVFNAAILIWILVSGGFFG